MAEPVRIGIDLGGTKTEILVLDASGKAILRERNATPRGDYAATVDNIAALVGDAERRLNVFGSVGVAIPGAVSPATGVIKNANSTWIIGQPLQQDLARKLERPVALSNDANCFALSEAVDGAGAGAETVFGVIIGTGTGGGIVIRHQVLSGPNAIAGEWGHNPLPWPEADEMPGPACYCGKTGCIETFLSGPGMAADYLAHGGEALDPPQILARADAGESAARACLDRYCERLAKGLASIINVLDPDCIVLGGGMSNLPQLYREVPARWGRYAFSDHLSTRLVPARFGDSSGVRGAAWLPEG